MKINEYPDQADDDDDDDDEGHEDGFAGSGFVFLATGARDFAGGAGAQVVAAAHAKHGVRDHGRFALGTEFMTRFMGLGRGFIGGRSQYGN